MEIEIKIPQLDKILSEMATLRAELCALAKAQPICTCSEVEPASQTETDSAEPAPKKQRRGRKPKAETVKTEPAETKAESVMDETSAVVEDDPFAELDASTETPKEITLDDIRELGSSKMADPENRRKIQEIFKQHTPNGKLSELAVGDYVAVFEAIKNV